MKIFQGTFGKPIARVFLEELIERKKKEREAIEENYPFNIETGSAVIPPDVLKVIHELGDTELLALTMLGLLEEHGG